MEKITITDELIDRFFSHDVTEAENAALAAWLDESEEHRERFQKAFDLHILTRTLAAEKAFSYSETVKRRITGGRVAAWLTGIAAAAALAFSVTWRIAVVPVEEKMAQEMSITAEPGHQSTITFSDGTRVRLNGGSTIKYPAVFGKTRQVELEGEAMFEVAKDIRHPFIVSTYRYDITVTGTRFDAHADSKEAVFSTALLEGSVYVTDTETGESIHMVPDQVVSNTAGGKLQVMTGEAVKDHTLWTEGILSIGGQPFDKLMRTFERAFGVRIIVERDDLPVIHYSRSKIRVSDGVQDALDLLQGGADFEYTYDSISDTYIIH
ncbi:MAG: FecR domain-containing protein [Bacteroidales bacterium]|nr:FecR domain-containing protein [Bacteroidales bacterium]